MFSIRLKSASRLVELSLGGVFAIGLIPESLSGNIKRDYKVFGA